MDLIWTSRFLVDDLKHRPPKDSGNRMRNDANARLKRAQPARPEMRKRAQRDKVVGKGENGFRQKG